MLSKVFKRFWIAKGDFSEVQRRVSDLLDEYVALADQIANFD